MQRTAAIFLALLLTIWASSASAQVYSGEDEGPQVLYSSSTTTTTTAVGIALIYATVASAIPDDSSAAVELYLRHNSVALAADLSLGAGDTVDDLARILNVPDGERPRFGRAVRIVSKRLIELADPDQLDRDRAHAFVLAARQSWKWLRLSEIRPT